MAEQWTTAQFTEWFEALFAEHDKNGDGKFDRPEAQAFARAVHASRKDGTEFNQERADAAWDKMAVDGFISKDQAWERLWEGAKKQGKISDA